MNSRAASSAHRRTYSGSVRSLVDSPGSDESDDGGGGRDHHDDEHSSTIFGDLSSTLTYSGGSASAHTRTSASHNTGGGGYHNNYNQRRIQVQIQDHGGIGNGNGHSHYHSHRHRPKLPLHEQGDGSDSRQPYLHSYPNPNVNAYRHPHPHPQRIRLQKENKKPRKLFPGDLDERERGQERDKILRRQSTFESTVTASSSVSEMNDNASVKSWRSKHSHQSGNGSAIIQEEEEKDPSMISSSYPRQHGHVRQDEKDDHRMDMQYKNPAPLISILDMENMRSHHTPDLNHNSRRRIDPTTSDAVVNMKTMGGGGGGRHGDRDADRDNESEKSTPNLNTGNETPNITNSNALILQSSNGMDPSPMGITPTLTTTNNNSSRFKNILSTVNQLPRPRLIPFSPLMTTTTTPSKPEDDAQSQSSSANNTHRITAASFAANAPKAGYLSKLGSSVSEYKRRFFVLKPTTCLYYFLSPNDEEPRGCIDLDVYFDRDGDGDGSEGLKVNSLGSLPDGRFRFEVLLPIPRDGPTCKRDESRQQQHRKILLEARNEEVGREWMKSLTEERLSFSKETVQRLQNQVDELQDDKKTLQQKVEELRLVEKDRDGAIEDANEWRKRAVKLDKGLVVLKRWVSRPVNDDCDEPGDNKKSQRYKAGTRNRSSNEAEVKAKGTHLSINKDDEELDEIDLPGTNFASLSNACRGLRENLRLASGETALALDDLHEANKKIKELEERMAKAEKYICKMWEENCSIREALKHKKNEKKLLVKEVRSLMEKASNDRNRIDDLQKKNKILAKANSSVKKNMKSASGSSKEKEEHRVRVTGKRQLNTPEMKLLFELEDHVSHSLVEHEYLLDDLDYINKIDDSSTEEPTKPTDKINASPTTTATTAKVSNSIADDAKSANLPHKIFDARDIDSSEEEVPSTNDIPKKYNFSPLVPKQLSLMDQVAFGENKKDKKVMELDPFPAKKNGLDGSGKAGMGPLLSTPSVNRANRGESDVRFDSNSLLNTSDEDSVKTDDDVKHPLAQLDAEVSIDTPTEISPKSLVTDNGKATSRLVCPLNDVAQSSENASNGRQGQQQVYSLTFYTQKIGLQFQKVPSNNRPNGILTEAMTADVEDDNESESVTATTRTEAELRLVASLSDPSYNLKAVEKKIPLKDQSCPVLLPKHYVLVCGYQGFDESSNNPKPSLGARLVGFDGISIERGPWTFEAVRKAIKARKRPLTLTFRDEYLNVEQRIVLTKAASQVENGGTPYQPPRPHSHLRHANVPVVIKDVPKLDDSTMSKISKSPSLSDITMPKFSHNGDMFSHHDDSTIDESNCSPANFSDTGSSSTFSTKFSALLPGLMAGLASGEKKKGDESLSFTPDYFRRSSDSLDSISHHKEFKASLL